MRTILLCLTLFFAGAGASLADDQKPWDTDPVVQEALGAVKAINAVILAHDVAAFEAMLADDAVVNSPGNVVVHRDGVIERFRNDQIAYSSYQHKIEFAGVRGDGVVVMGEEIVKPIANAPNAGKTVHRRFTDIWKKASDGWKLAVRQATVISVE